MKTYAELQTVMIELMGLKEGDKVYVTHAATRGEMGWSDSWNQNMDGYVGKEHEVQEISDGGVYLGWNFPIFVIRKVIKQPVTVKLTDNYDAVIDHMGTTKVGCQTIPFDKLEEVYNIASAQREL
jgi:hypothetical protein